ncbi:MAG: hypothetical protein Q7R51_03270 [bacterium]|nr:hypothetical protein [bacterium]
MDEGKGGLEQNPANKDSSFPEIVRKLQVYLVDPSSEYPYDFINTYFNSTADSQSPEHRAQNAERLLTIMKNRMREQINPHWDIEHGNMGSIATGLPYFYPLNLTVLSWYLYSELDVDRVRNLDEKQKMETAEMLRGKASEYDPYGVDKGKNNDLINRYLFPVSKISQEKPPAKQSPRWHQKLNPFRKK